MHQAGPRGCGDLMATRVTERTHPWATGRERSKARAGKEFCFSPSIFLEAFSLPPSGRRCLGNLGGPVPRDAEVSWEEQGWAWGQSSTGAWWKHPQGHHPGAGIKPWRKQEVTQRLKSHQDTPLSLVCEVSLPPTRMSSIHSIEIAAPSLIFSIGGKEHQAMKGDVLGTPLVVQWLRFRAPNARGSGLNCGEGSRSHTPQQRSKILHVATKTPCSQRDTF